MSPIKIRTNATLAGIEDLLARKPADGSAEVWLPRKLSPAFFIHSHISALITTLGLSSRLCVKHWDVRPSVSKAGLIDLLSRDLLHATATMVSERVGTASRFSELQPSARMRGPLVKKVTEQLGLIDVDEGRSYTICAFDPDAPSPLVLPDLANAIAFKRAIVDLRRQWLEVGSASQYSKHIALLPPTVESNLATFIYELFLNSQQHGTLNDDNQPIPGLRFISYRKHVANSAAALRSRASGFPELEQYLDSTYRSAGPQFFYEISIGDQGLGIVRRFLATRSEYSAENSDARMELLNAIIDKSLSSKVGQFGAGLGLRRALEAVGRLNGFLMLRTDDLWTFWSTHVGGHAMSRVSCKNNPETIRGTYINLLFPTDIGVG